MKKRIILIAVLLIAVGVVFASTIVRENAGTSERGTPGTGRNRSAAREISSHVFTVRSEEAETRTLEAYLEVNANIVSGHQVAVLPDAGGRLVSMFAGLGDVVQRGTLLAEVDPSRPGTVFSLSPVYAPVSGMLVSVPQSIGATVSTSTALMTIAVNGSIEIEALIPEREVGQLRTGLKAEIRLEAFPGEIFPATLTQVSPVVDPVSRTKKIIMRFDRADPRIKTGMFARVKLNTRTYKDVVSVPQGALVEHRGKTIVYVLNNDPAGAANVEMREVTAGVTVDGELEIKSGLKPGEAVVVQGQQFLTDGAPVRVIGRRI